MTDTALSAADAARRILARIRVQPAVTVPLDDALGMVLAEDVRSPLDLPPYANAGMDGYACRAEDVRGATAATPVQLRVVEQIAAGAFPTIVIAAGTCARIFTGAPMPAGADTVIRQEDTDLGTTRVEIRHDRDAGVNVRAAGEDLRLAALAIAAGTPLGAPHLGVLASIAVARPRVYRRPRVGLLSSGDELASVHDREAIVSGRKIASSNTHSLAALVRLAGAEPIMLGVAADTPASLRACIARAAECDLLVTSAGISVGDHDHVRGVMTDLGTEMDFWRLRMRPGAPVGFGLLGELPWIGLPGNPVSAMVTCELFVRPAIRRMIGHALPFRRGTTVHTADAIALAPRLQHFLRVQLEPGTDGVERARLTGAQGSGLLTSMMRADALLVVPEGQHQTPAGASLTALRLDEARHQAEPAF